MNFPPLSSFMVRVAFLIFAVASGCAVGPNYKIPGSDTPGSFDLELAAIPATGPSTRPAARAAGTRPVDIAYWWRSLDDPEIDSLVVRAIRSNYDLRIALMRLQEARTTEYVVTGATLPLIDVAGGAGRGTGSDSTRGRIPGPLHSAASTTGLKEITEVGGFDAFWEVDLWGRFARQVEATRADTQAAAELRNNVLITVVADVIRADVDVRAEQLRLQIAVQNVETARQTVQLLTTRFNRGLTNELDVQLARRQLASEEAAIAPLAAAVAQAQRRLAVLLGMSPQVLNGELRDAAEMPTPPDQVDPGIPVDLLRRRPDIREAERKLAAATARIGVATADLFPRVDLLGSLGVQGQGLGRVPVEEKSIWSFGPAAYWPALDFGTLDSLVEVQDLRTRELLYAYRRLVLVAVEEVDDAVSNYTAQRQRLASLNDAVTASQAAVRLASQRYERGLTDFLNVLDAQRQLYELEDQYAVAQESVVVEYIALYKALGGGWEHFQNIPSIRHPQPAVIAAGVTVTRGGQPLDATNPKNEPVP